MGWWATRLMWWQKRAEFVYGSAVCTTARVCDIVSVHLALLRWTRRPRNQAVLTRTIQINLLRCTYPCTCPRSAYLGRSPLRPYPFSCKSCRTQSASIYNETRCQFCRCFCTTNWGLNSPPTYSTIWSQLLYYPCELVPSIFFNGGPRSDQTDLGHLRQLLAQFSRCFLPPSAWSGLSRWGASYMERIALCWQIQRLISSSLASSLILLNFVVLTIMWRQRRETARF